MTQLCESICSNVTRKVSVKFDNRYKTNKNEHNSSLKQLVWIMAVQLMHDTCIK